MRIVHLPRDTTAATCYSAFNAETHTTHPLPRRVKEIGSTMTDSNTPNLFDAAAVGSRKPKAEKEDLGQFTYVLDSNNEIDGEVNAFYPRGKGHNRRGRAKLSLQITMVLFDEAPADNYPHATADVVARFGQEMVDALRASIR